MPRLVRTVTAPLCALCLLLLCLSFGGAHPVLPADDESAIPGGILDRAAEHLTAKLGLEFYLAYLDVDKTRSRYQDSMPGCLSPTARCKDYFKRPYYELFYWFRIPALHFVDETMVCYTGCVPSPVENFWRSLC